MTYTIYTLITSNTFTNIKVTVKLHPRDLEIIKDIVDLNKYIVLFNLITKLRNNYTFNDIQLKLKKRTLKT